MAGRGKPFSLENHNHANKIKTQYLGERGLHQQHNKIRVSTYGQLARLYNP